MRCKRLFDPLIRHIADSLLIRPIYRIYPLVRSCPCPCPSPIFVTCTPLPSLPCSKDCFRALVLFRTRAPVNLLLESFVGPSDRRACWTVWLISTDLPICIFVRIGSECKTLDHEARQGRDYSRVAKETLSSVHSSRKGKTLGNERKRRRVAVGRSSQSTPRPRNVRAAQRQRSSLES